jgi:hypothetical protein
MSDLVAYTKERAADLEHEWDRRALDWPLTGESVVVEVGGYTGRWALQIAGRYQPRLYVFEPQPWAADACRAVLGDRATVEGYGLGAQSGGLPMGCWETDGCSFLRPIEGSGWGEMREIGAAFTDLGITHIDLMMVNIEGYEYALIPHMLDKAILPQRLMVQFHTFADSDGSKAAAIHERLAGLGYAIPWTYGTILTAWERQGDRKPKSRRGRRS